ncbi:MAG: ubiquitin-like small modifier protein 1 [Acidimicrobiales bacterium]
MPVEIRLPSILRVHADGKSIVEGKGSTVGEVLQDVVNSYPGMEGQVVTADGSLHKFVNVYLNDDDIRYLGSLDTPVSDSDTISILPAVAGGAGEAAPDPQDGVAMLAGLGW